MKSWFFSHSPAFLFLLCLLQPALDVLSFWMDAAGLPNTLTLLLRLGLLGMTVCFGFLLSHRKWLYGALTGVCLLLWLGHLAALQEAGAFSLTMEVTNFVRVIQLPWMTLSLISMLTAQPACYDSLVRGIGSALGIILLVLLLAFVTGTEPHTYEDGSGWLGWFSNTNAQSAILCLVVPVGAVWAFSRFGLPSPLFWLALVGGFGSMALLGTRLAYAGMVAAGLSIPASLLLTQPGNRRQALPFLLVCLALVALMPFSPMARHQKLYTAVQTDRQAGIDQSLDQAQLPPLDEPGLSQEALQQRESLWVEALTPIYTLYAPDFVHHFGAEDTIRLYQFSTDIGDFTELRPKKLKFARQLMAQSPPSARFFGLALDRFLAEGQNYDVENDFHGIYYLYGGVGLGLLLVFLGYFLLQPLRVLGQHRIPTPAFTAWTVGLGGLLVHACFTAGVLRRPNASFYLAACLSALYFLTRPPLKEAR